MNGNRLIGFSLAAALVACAGKPLPTVEDPDTEPRDERTADGGAGVDAAVRDASVDDAAAGMDASLAPDMAGPACNARTCAGCCMNDVCQTGSTNAACGKGAGACQVCASPDACLASQVCGLPPEKEWILAVESAGIAAKNPSGGDWDFPNPAPDPFLQTGTLRLTATISDSYRAAWPYVYTFTTRTLLDGTFAIAMFDEDVAAHDQIAPARSVKFSESDIRKGFLDWTSWGSCGAIRWTVKPKP